MNKVYIIKQTCVKLRSLKKFDAKLTCVKYIEILMLTAHPNSEDLYATLEGWVFTKLNPSQAYNKLKLDEESEQICPIKTPDVVFQFTRMPFRITSEGRCLFATGNRFRI